MRTVLSLFLFTLSYGHVVGQMDGRSFSSIQFVNAASTESLRLHVADKVWHSTLRPGQKTSAGAFPRLHWPLRLHATGEGTRLESQFEAQSGKSYVAVIVGDFKEDDPREFSTLRATNTASSNKEGVRATILYLPNEIAPGRGHRLRIVNGLVETPMKFSCHESDQITAEYGEIRTFSGLPAATDLRVEAGDKIFNLSFLFVPPERGCTIAFYRLADEIGYVTANEVILLPDGSLPSATEKEIEQVLNQFDGSAHEQLKCEH